MWNQELQLIMQQGKACKIINIRKTIENLLKMMYYSPSLNSSDYYSIIINSKKEKYKKQESDAY